MRKIVLVLLAVCFALSNSYAQELNLLFLERVSYDDNIYLTKDNKEGSFISSTKLGLEFKSEVPSSSFEFNAGALGGFDYYLKDPSVNNNFNALAYLGLENENILIKDVFVYTSDPADSALTERAERVNNVTNLYFVTSKENIISIGAGLNNIYDRYLEEKYDYLSRNRTDVLAEVLYNISPETNVYLNYTASFIGYYRNMENDSLGNSVGVGIKGNILPLITANAKLSYDMRDYKNDRVDSSGNHAQNDMSLLGYFVSLQWDPYETTSLLLSGHRRAEETLYGLDRYYISTTVSLYGFQKVYGIFGASLLGSFEEMDYTDNTYRDARTDNLYTVRPAVEIDTSMGTKVVIWYAYKDKTSNTSENFEYVDNVVGAEFRFTF